MNCLIIYPTCLVLVLLASQWEGGETCSTESSDVMSPEDYSKEVKAEGKIRRFLSKVKGYWLLHCHIEFHLEVGMAVVFKIGEDEEMPEAPDNFPKCGDFRNTISEKGTYGGKR